MKREGLAIRAISNMALIFLAVCCIVPFLSVISSSLTEESYLTRYGYNLLPKKFDFSAYKLLFTNGNTLRNAYMVTAFVTAAGTVGSIVVSAQFAYTLSRREFMLSKFLSLYLFITMLFSGGMVPWYILITRYLHLKDSLFALIIPCLVSSWNIFLLKSHFKAVPEEVIEAARIDGANEFYIFYGIVFPIAKGGIATVAIFIMLTFWNDWYNNMLFITSPEKYSLQYMLQSLLLKVETLQIAQSSLGADVGEIPKNSIRMATCVAAAGPMVFVFSFFQKYFVKGITVGSIK
ncbi:MAG: carbohydrate ABC transporter permease [Clostridia bacterium]|nr:carbohydrate ABC transporter permease [Clostridia bacterium]